MIAFFEVALRLQYAQILPLDSWKAILVRGSLDAAKRSVQMVVIHQQSPAWLH